jgi:anionic cell wall polymer biosynthesis LytR-Cps2A-Psr (LCP) family protein
MRKITIIIIAFLCALLLFFFLKIKNFYETIYKGAPITHAKSQEIKKKTTYNIILLGYGGGNHDGTYLTDSIMIAHIDMVQKKALLFSIPRDIWVHVPTKSDNGFNIKINALYQMGLYPNNYPDLPDKFRNSNRPAELIKDQASQITGLTIDNFIAVDFDTFKKIIDGIGGVDINVDTAFDDYEYPIDGKENDLCGKTEADLPELLRIATEEAVFKAFPCRYETLHFDRGMTHMDGETALKYSRSRHSLQDGNDFARGRRQQKLILGVKDKVLSVSFIPKILPLMETLKSDVQTDLSVDDITNLLALSTHANEYKISNLVLSDDNYLQSSYSENGQSILIEKDNGAGWQDIHTWIRDTLDGVTPTPVATKSAIMNK